MSYYQYSSDRREFLELQYWEQREKLRSLTLRFTHYDGQLLTDVADKEKYELSLCWNPWDPYIPEQDRIHMEKPVFDAEDLTDDVLNARIYNDYRFDRQQKKYYAEPRMEFGIRFGNVVVYVFASNMTAEEVLEIIEKM